MNRFDICEGWYLALSHCHGGQWSPEYARLSRMTRYFKPSPLLSVEGLSEDARAVYDGACAQMLGTQEEPEDACTHPGGHQFECTGTQYGGDDERWHGEGRCLCIHCGADGDG